MVVGSVAIADQYSGESIAQRFVHHRLAPTPPQEVAFGGGAESPHVAIGPVLAPAGFVGVDHWAGADAVQDRGHRWLGPLRGLVNGAHDGPHAELASAVGKIRRNASANPIGASILPVSSALLIPAVVRTIFIT